LQTQICALYISFIATNLQNLFKALLCFLQLANICVRDSLSVECLLVIWVFFQSLRGILDGVVILFSFDVAMRQIHTGQDFHLFYKFYSHILRSDHRVIFYFEEVL